MILRNLPNSEAQYCRASPGLPAFVQGMATTGRQSCNGDHHVL
jgi:hypothetical protein